MGLFGWIRFREEGVSSKLAPLVVWPPSFRLLFSRLSLLLMA